MEIEAPDPPERDAAEFRSSGRSVARVPSLIRGLLGLIALSLLAGGAPPAVLILLFELVPPTSATPFVVLVMMAFGFVPFVSLAFTCWIVPMAWHGSVLVRLLVCGLLVSATLSAAAAAQWAVNASLSSVEIHIVSAEMIPGVVAFVAGMAIVGMVPSLWFGWNLCERGTQAAEIPATSIRQLLEVTAGAGVVYACLAALLPSTAAVPPYLVTIFLGMLVGAAGWLRLNALSPRLATRRRARWIASGLAFAAWYAMTAMTFHQTDGFWRFYDWRIWFTAAASTVSFVWSSVLPLVWLRRRGWMLWKRGTWRRSVTASA